MEKKYISTIGLEIHAELKTKTKMFCNSKNDPEEKIPNKNICPICVGHPGTLPAINAEAVKNILKIGVAVNGKISDFSEFDRKNYFYPDIPKGYQISQYKYPLIDGGELDGVRLTRIHLEEDTAKSYHKDSGHSLLDFNRAGVPLMELVTEPVIKTSEKAARFAKELQILLRYLGVSEANMEKGEMRVEANISVSNTGKLGTKVEVKNLNSFRSVERAIEFEIKRQEDTLRSGGEITQETRGWDENKGETFSQRKKEESHDYRYFPDPDLPKLKISNTSIFSSDKIRGELPELPWEKRERYISLGLKPEDADFFVRSFSFDKFFQAVMKLSDDKNILILAGNYIITDLVGMSKNDSNVSINASDFVELIKMIKSGHLSSRGAKDILSVMALKGGNPNVIAKEKNLFQRNDESELGMIIDTVIKNNQQAWSEFKNGKESTLQFLVGQGMRETKGSANPEVLKSLFKSKL